MTAPGGVRPKPSLRRVLGTVAWSALALVLLYVGTVIALVVIKPTAKGIIGGLTYYGVVVVLPVSIGLRSKTLVWSIRLREMAMLSVSAQIFFIPIGLAVLAF